MECLTRGFAYKEKKVLTRKRRYSQGKEGTHRNIGSWASRLDYINFWSTVNQFSYIGLFR
jgi:hypothetical protein